ncbi:uncharacterized protein LOC131223226 isoform X2 [Magnolia sinica]|uniref:uncharacterized protein LOC131223226 isoform X2 n=1 Tax=Magnolia sinica TaxID=86752 RepID=UPI002657F28C|nr:uncharacterized protein LOC131223226 isoform X2 [Magnolia sinica]
MSYLECDVCELSSLGGLSSINLSNCYLDSTKTKCGRLEASYGMRRAWIRQKAVRFAGLLQLRRSADSLTVSCGPSSETVKNLGDDLEEKKSISSTGHVIPNSLQVESLLTQICDTSTIAEFELKLGGFRLYVTRDLKGKSEPLLPPSPPPINTNVAVETPDLNGSVTTPSLALSKPKPSIGGIQRLLETATDEGLVILQSPKVGYFRRSRTIKGKRAPPPCKEKQAVKEGQVLCYIEQLGGEIPIESDVSGEVIKILRDDGEPVGYGDALIAILPSFPGIKKLQ